LDEEIKGQKHEDLKTRAQTRRGYNQKKPWRKETTRPSGDRKTLIGGRSTGTKKDRMNEGNKARWDPVRRWSSSASTEKKEHNQGSKRYLGRGRTLGGKDEDCSITIDWGKGAYLLGQGSKEKSNGKSEEERKKIYRGEGHCEVGFGWKATGANQSTASKKKKNE